MHSPGRDQIFNLKIKFTLASPMFHSQTKAGLQIWVRHLSRWWDSMQSTVFSLISWIHLEIVYPSKISPHGPFNHHLFLFSFIFATPIPLSSLHTNHRNRIMSLDLRDPKRPTSPSPPYISHLESPPLVITHTRITPSFVLELLSEWGTPGLFAHERNGERWRHNKKTVVGGKGGR